MAERKGFDLAAVLKGVPDLDTGEEQIVRLPLDAIDPDPDNFYSLEGLEELAGNIETVGLLDPIRVRPNGERYTVVSGHRRRAACLLIRDGGSKQFSGGVPCIVEYGEASDAMRRLRLIYANSATRQLTSAEQSRQAEEVTRLLYELKEQGVEFPGRMRDHVAEACNLTKSKIGRLHAIRANLIPELLAFFDGGEMVEDVAYQLSRFPEEIQKALAEKLNDGRKHKMPVGSTVDAVWRNLEELQKPMSCRAHAGGLDCHHLTGRIIHSLGQQYSWAICNPGQCCMDCYKAKEGCSGACREARDRAKLDKAVEDEKKAERERDAEIAQRVLKNRIREGAAPELCRERRAQGRRQDQQRLPERHRRAAAQVGGRGDGRRALLRRRVCQARLDKGRRRDGPPPGLQPGAGHGPAGEKRGDRTAKRSPGRRGGGSGGMERWKAKKGRLVRYDLHLAGRS